MSETWNVIGTMSGTSMDGLDIAYCRFQSKDDTWSFEIKASETIPYNLHWRERLTDIAALKLPEYLQLDSDLGLFTAKAISNYFDADDLKNCDLIVSHGHTVFHSPENGISDQIGAAAPIVEHCNIPVVNDLRRADIANGGQGAPIVPIGDLHLFPTYKYCLNLGGIMNVSLKESGRVKAWDVSACNLILNYLAAEKELAFDSGGGLAASGSIDAALLDKLMDWKYLKLEAPKSLEAASIRQELFPILDESSSSVEDKLNTCVHFMANALVNALMNDLGETNASESMLVTGGGAKNDFLISVLNEKLDCKVVLPSEELIDQKEAMVMAFFGLLRMLEIPNYIPSVTGARIASIGGALHIPSQKTFL